MKLARIKVESTNLLGQQRDLTAKGAKNSVVKLCVLCALCGDIKLIGSVFSPRFSA